jgi:hypothetical protein
VGQDQFHWQLETDGVQLGICRLNETDLRRNGLGAGILECKEVNMVDLKDMMAELQQKRDEIKLQLKLGSMEAEDEWDSLVSEWDTFLSASQFERSAEEVGEAAREMGLKMKIAYDRAKNAVG